MKYSIGTDFEFPIFNKKTKQPVSAVGIIGGTKNDPLSIGENCFRHEDNVMAEFGVPPSENFEDFTKHIDYCIGKGRDVIQVHNKDLDFNFVSSQNYSASELDSDIAMEFGCLPSFCVYTQDESPRPSPEEVGQLRTAGFHIHIGFKDNLPKINDIERMVKLMDYHLGLPSLLLDPDKDRRKIYGNAGDFRIKPYGFEYRTLGTGMMASFDLIEFVWDQLHKVFEDFEGAVTYEVIENGEIQGIIDNDNDEKALELCQHLELVQKIKVTI